MWLLSFPGLVHCYKKVMFHTCKYERNAEIICASVSHERESTQSRIHFPWLCPLTSCSRAGLQEASVPRGRGSDPAQRLQRWRLHNTHTSQGGKEREGGPWPALFHALYTHAPGNDKHALYSKWQAEMMRMTACLRLQQEFIGDHIPLQNEERK